MEIKRKCIEGFKERRIKVRDEVKSRIKEVKRRILQESEKRKRNFLIKRVEIKEGKRRKVVEEEIGTKMDIEEYKK